MEVGGGAPPIIFLQETETSDLNKFTQKYIVIDVWFILKDLKFSFISSFSAVVSMYSQQPC